MLEATMHALKHPAYSQRYQRNKRRLGKQRGAKVAQIDIARRLTHAIWHMLSRKQTVRSQRRRFSSGGLTAPFRTCARERSIQSRLILPPRRP